MFDSIALDAATILALPFSFTQPAHYIISQIAQYPAQDWTPAEVLSVWDVLNRSYGRWIAFFLGALFLLWTSAKGVRFRYRRRHSITSLLPLFAAENPALRPVLLVNALKEPLDGGPWELPRSPLQWALAHNLIVDRDGKPLAHEVFFEKSGLVREKARYRRDRTLHPIGGYKLDGVRLDQSNAEAAFAKQLALELPEDQALMRPDCSNLPPYLKALCAAAMAWGVGDRDLCMEILDTMNLEWHPPRKAQPGGWKWRGTPVRMIPVDELFTDVRSWMKLSEVHTQGEDLFAETGANALEKYDDSIARKWWSFGLLVGKYTGRDLPAAGNRPARREYIWRWRLRSMWPLVPYKKPVPARPEVIPTCGDGSLIQAAFDRHLKNEDVKDVFDQHGHWAGAFVYGLTLFALKRGAFITPLFIWLRSVNQTAFHAFNQAGGATVWAKASGIASHVDYEAVFGARIDKPMVKPAVESLDQSLKDEGWYN
jgi:hypothetical protein